MALLKADILIILHSYQENVPRKLRIVATKRKYDQRFIKVFRKLKLLSIIILRARPGFQF